MSSSILNYIAESSYVVKKKFPIPPEFDKGVVPTTDILTYPEYVDGKTFSIVMVLAEVSMTHLSVNSELV